jgi:hypothetical protein
MVPDSVTCILCDPGFIQLKDFDQKPHAADNKDLSGVTVTDVLVVVTQSLFATSERASAASTPLNRHSPNLAN